MPSARKRKIRQRILWTAADVKQLRSAAKKTPVAQIAKQLKRSEAAVRYKASILKISLALKRR